jgi:ABC-type branched-subunit amino acid transport system ATPase component
LRTGEIVLEGSASELRQNSERVAQAYLGGGHA